MDINISNDKDIYSSKVSKFEKSDDMKLECLDRVLEFKEVKKDGQYIVNRQRPAGYEKMMIQFLGKCAGCGELFSITVSDENAGITACECKAKYFIDEGKLYRVK